MFTTRGLSLRPTAAQWIAWCGLRVAYALDDDAMFELTSCAKAMGIGDA